MSTQAETPAIGQDREGEGKPESLTSYLLTQGLVNLRLRALGCVNEGHLISTMPPDNRPDRWEEMR